MILGMINVTSHDCNNLWDIEGQVLVDSKELQIIKEEDKLFNLFQIFQILFKT